MYAACIGSDEAPAMHTYVHAVVCMHASSCVRGCTCAWSRGLDMPEGRKWNGSRVKGGSMVHACAGVGRWALHSRNAVHGLAHVHVARPHALARTWGKSFGICQAAACTSPHARNVKDTTAPRMAWHFKRPSPPSPLCHKLLCFTACLVGLTDTRARSRHPTLCWSPNTPGIGPATSTGSNSCKQEAAERSRGQPHRSRNPQLAGQDSGRAGGRRPSPQRT